MDDPDRCAGGGRHGFQPARPGQRLVRPAHAVGATGFRRGRSGPLQSRLLARLFQAGPRRCRVPQRRRMRGLLSHQGAAALPQQVPRRWRHLRRNASRLPQTRHDCDRARRSPRRPSGCLRRSSGLDCRGSQRSASPPLGDAHGMGDLRARPLQLRVHDQRDPGDHDALQGRRHLRQPLERVGHVLLPALPAEFQGIQRIGTSTGSGSARRRARSVHCMAEETPPGFVFTLGRRDQEAQPGGRVLSQRLRPDTRQRFGADSLCGSAKPLRVPVALAERQECEGGPHDLRLQANRRHL